MEYSFVYTRRSKCFILFLQTRLTFNRRVWVPLIIEVEVGRDRDRKMGR